MTNFQLTEHKSPENIQRRIHAKCNSFARSILYPYNPNGTYQLQNSKIQLQEGEIPLFEYYSSLGYLLITTTHLYSNIKIKMGDSIYYRNYSTPVEQISYTGNAWDIIAERKDRIQYQEEIIKHIPTTTGESIEVIIPTGVTENILHEVLTQIVWMCNKYRVVEEGKIGR